MNAFIEPLILYAVLFLPAAIPQAPLPDLIPFSPYGELIRIFLYNIPALMLIWYLLFKTRTPGEWNLGRPRMTDLLTAAIALPAMILIGLTISFVALFFTSLSPGVQIGTPSHPAGWIIMGFSCISTGCLEESFFRFYLLNKLRGFGTPAGLAAFISVLFFSICHIYEGPWGTLNAVLAGTLLAALFFRFKALYGLALAHGLYNIFVYVMSS
jgi:membrane protease YdiL (CAAX protease family)